MSQNSNPPGQETDQAKIGLIQEYWQAIRAFSPSLRRLLLSMSLILFTAFGLQPVLQNLYLLRLGFDVQFIGLLAGIGQVVWAAAAIPSGLLGNRIGLRNSLLLGCALFGLGLALLLLVGNVPLSQWPVWLIISQVVLWCGVALITVNNPPYLMSVTNQRERRYAFAVFSSTGPSMAFLGSLIGGALPQLLVNRFGFSLDQPDPYRLALWLGVILAGSAVAVLFPAEAAYVTRHGGEERSTVSAPLALMAFVGLLAFLASYSDGALRTFFNVYLDTGLGLPPAAIGSVMGLAQLLPIAAALSVPLLINRLGTGNALMASLVAAAAFLAVLGSTTLVWVVLITYTVAAAMNTVKNTTRDMFGQEIVHARWRTGTQSISIVGAALGWALAGISGGALIQASGFAALYFVSALCAILAAGLVLGYQRLVGGRPVKVVYD